MDTDEHDVVAIGAKKKEFNKELEIKQAETKSKIREAERVQHEVDSLAREEERSKLSLYELTTHR